MRTSHFIFVIIFSVVVNCDAKYVIPDITIKAYKPKGLTVSIPDSNGVQQFGFHANLNQNIKGKEEGTISLDVTYPENGLWNLKDSNVQLKIGDVLNYWVFVQHNRLGFDKQDQKFEITALVEEINSCKDSITKINGDQKTCENTIIFEDNFNDLDETKWTIQQYIPWEPDYEFNTYERNSANCYASNGDLTLKATPRSLDKIALPVDLRQGCTKTLPTECYRNATGNIFAPTNGAKIRSTFSFKYGTIEIRAKLPRGDWTYSQLQLEPRDNSNGIMWIAFARGNEDLKEPVSGNQIGNKILYSGPVVLSDPDRTSKTKSKTTSNSWGADYHTYRLKWTPNEIVVSVDNESEQVITPPYSTSFSSLFEREFVVSFGIGVGGLNNFPDDSTSNNKKIPWRKLSSKAGLLFHNSRNDWLPSWDNDRSSVKIDYVRVWSI